MNLIQTEQIELTASEINALDIAYRIGKRLANEARNPAHRAKGEAIYEACTVLDFVRSDEEDPNETILRRRDLQSVYDGTCDIESLKAILPVECSNIIDDACETAEQNGYENGHDFGYDEGYNDRVEEEEEDE